MPPLYCPQIWFTDFCKTLSLWQAIHHQSSPHSSPSWLFLYSPLWHLTPPPPDVKEGPLAHRNIHILIAPAAFACWATRLGCIKFDKTLSLTMNKYLNLLSQHLYLRKMLILWGRMGDINETIHTKHLVQCLAHLRDTCYWETHTHRKKK